MKKITLTAIMFYFGFLAFAQVDEEQNQEYQKAHCHNGHGNVLITISEVKWISDQNRCAERQPYRSGQETK